MRQLPVESVANDGSVPEQSLLSDDTDPFFRSQVSESLPLPGSTRSALTPIVDPSQDRSTRLGDFFVIAEEPRLRYSDWEIWKISRHLEENQKYTWSQAPRLYTVLRIIGQLQCLDDILDQGISDIWFPFKEVSIPTLMSSSMRKRFLEVQPLVLTKAVDLEKSEKKHHAHFGREDIFPFEVRERLGRGGHGAVDKIFSPLSRREFARKRFKRASGPSQRGEVRKFRTELQTLKKIQHHHCIELIASYTDTKYFGLIMSPVADCTLTKYYPLVEKDVTSRRTMRKFFGCLASGLCYLHDIKIRHRDIKPENILVRGSDVLLSDFGISLDWEHLSRSTTTEDSGKTWIYCAPEVAHHQPRNRSSDIWSLGCVFLEMSTVLKGQSLETMRQHFNDRSNSYRFYQNLTAIQEWLKELASRSENDNDPLNWITLMLHEDPKFRPKADELLTTIKKATFKKGSEKVVYYGECCTTSEESDSTAESASDDDLWAGDPTEEAEEDKDDEDEEEQDEDEDEDEDEDVEGEGTSPLTDDAASSAGSRESPSLDEASVAALSSLAGPVAKTPGMKICRKPLSKAIDPALDQEAPKDTVGEVEVSIERTNSPRPSEAATDLTPIMMADAWTSLGVASDIENFNLCGHLPRLTLGSWNTPSCLLGAVKQDEDFMAYLRSQVAQTYKFIEVATTEDVTRLVQLLVDNGLNVYSSDSTNGIPPILKIMDWGKGEWEASLLAMIYAKAAADHLQSYQRPVLMRAAALGYVGAMRALIHAGAGSVLGDETAAAALVVAVKNGQVDAVRYLVETVKVKPDLDGAVARLSQLGGLTPLSWAASKGHMELVRVLFASGASLYPSNSLDPISAAATKNQLEVVRYFIEDGKAQRDKPDGSNHLQTALVAASRDGHASVVRYLLESGALKAGKSAGIHYDAPLYAASRRSRTEVVRVLLAHGIDPNRFKRRISPLHVAVARNDVAIVKLLLKSGATVSTRTRSLGLGQTAIEIARERGYSEILTLLEKAKKKQKAEKAKRMAF